MPFFSKNRRVSSGYSLDTRTPCGRSSTLVAGLSAATATTIFTGRALTFEYWSSPRETTSLAVSSIQSRPVIPRSNSPSATYCGISCGRRIRTSSMRGSSIDALYSTSELRRTLRSAASNNSMVARSREPFGRTSFSTAPSWLRARAVPSAFDERAHLQRSRGALFAHVVAPGVLRPCQRLVDVFGRQHTEGNRHTGRQLRVLQPARGLGGHEFVVHR